MSSPRRYLVFLVLTAFFLQSCAVTVNGIDLRRQPASEKVKYDPGAGREKDKIDAGPLDAVVVFGAAIILSLAGTALSIWSCLAQMQPKG